MQDAFLNHLEPEARARLREAAVHEAHRLRAEAMDDFWRGANALVASGFGGLGRSTERLRQRLARHRLRAAVAGAVTVRPPARQRLRQPLPEWRVPARDRTMNLQAK